MTDPSRPRPAPGPRPGPPPGVAPRPGPTGAPATADAPSAPTAGPGLAGLAQRPVGEHVAAFEAEHDRLRRELATIDQL